MSLLCWNARGLGDLKALRRCRFAIRKLSPTFVFVSETNLYGNRISSLSKSFGFFCMVLEWIAEEVKVG